MKNIILRRIKKAYIAAPPPAIVYESQVDSSAHPDRVRPEDIISNYTNPLRNPEYVAKLKADMEQKKKNVDKTNAKLLSKMAEHEHTIIDDATNYAKRLWDKITSIGHQDTSFEATMRIENGVVFADEQDKIKEALIEHFDDIFGNDDIEIRVDTLKNWYDIYDVRYKISGKCTSKLSKEQLQKILTFNNVAKIEELSINTEKEAYYTNQFIISREQQKQQKEKAKTENRDITTPDMPYIDRLRAVCKYIGQKTGLNPYFVMAQHIHESGYNGSDLSQSWHNYGGLKAEGNYERDQYGHTKFNSDKEYADAWIEQIANKYPGLTKSKTIDEYLDRISGYFEDNKASYWKDTKQIFKELTSEG